MIMARRVTLGRTGLEVNFSAFGCLPIQRVSEADAVKVLRHALDNGFNFFDTARYYTDSERKLGLAFQGCRDRLLIASKSMAKTAETLRCELDESLRELRTDHVDIWQFHNPASVPKPDDGSGMYEVAVEAQKAGKVRFIGITSHRIKYAQDAVESGLYDTVQYPLNYLSTPEELELPALCHEKNIGCLAMKGLSGGLITRPELAYGALSQLKYVVALWGIERMEQLEDFLALDRQADAALSEEQQAAIQKDRDELCGEFCRGCGYCMPCPAGIEIWNCARMSLLLKRSVVALHTSPAWREKMEKVKGCLHCGRCAARCPYGLNTPELLQKNYREYQDSLKQLGLE